MQQTTNLGLNKPDYNDMADIGVINGNMDIIDEKITELQSGSGVKIYTVAELTDPQENKIYNVKIEENTSTINEKSVYKEGTTELVTLKAGKVATVYYQGGNFFYKASASGDAVAENVLAGKKFSNDDGTDIVGTMENHGGKVFKPSAVNIIISKGFHNGTGYVEGDPNLVSGNIVQGKQIFGVDGNAEIITTSQKEGLANAITSKGVPTSTSASLSTMEQNIRSISIKKIDTKSQPNAIPFYNRYSTGGRRYLDYRANVPVSKNGIVRVFADFGFHNSENEVLSSNVFQFSVSVSGSTLILEKKYADYYHNSDMITRRECIFETYYGGNCLIEISVQLDEPFFQYRNLNHAKMYYIIHTV